MNKTIKIMGLICSFFCICNGLVAQTNFNTARYEKPTEDRNMFVEVEEKESPKEDEKSKKEGWLKGWFKRKKHPDFQQEIDSLKKMIIQKDKEHKHTINQIENSLGQIIKNEVLKVEESKKTPVNIKRAKIYTPLKMMFVTSPFGNRMHPIDKEIKKHNGIDLRANYDRVYSIMDGQVIDTGFDKNGGKYIKIAHSNKFETLYMHLSEIYYKKGDSIKAGFIIAKSGNTGKSTHPHLHFAVKESGKFINPMKFLTQLIEINNILNINEYGAK